MTNATAQAGVEQAAHTWSAPRLEPLSRAAPLSPKELAGIVEALCGCVRDPWNPEKLYDYNRGPWPNEADIEEVIKSEARELLVRRTPDSEPERLPRQRLKFWYREGALLTRQLEILPCGSTFEGPVHIWYPVFRARSGDGAPATAVIPENIAVLLGNKRPEGFDVVYRYFRSNNINIRTRRSSGPLGDWTIAKALAGIGNRKYSECSDEEKGNISKWQQRIPRIQDRLSAVEDLDSAEEAIFFAELDRIYLRPFKV